MLRRNSVASVSDRRRIASLEICTMTRYGAVSARSAIARTIARRENQPATSSDVRHQRPRLPSWCTSIDGARPSLIKYDAPSQTNLTRNILLNCRRILAQVVRARVRSLMIRGLDEV